MGMDDKFNEMKGKAKQKASDMADEAKERGGEIFNKDRDSSKDDEQGGVMDDIKERGKDAVSKFKDRGDEE